MPFYDLIHRDFKEVVFRSSQAVAVHATSFSYLEVANISGLMVYARELYEMHSIIFFFTKKCIY